MKKYHINSFLFTLAFVLLLVACKKDSPVPENPFDDPALDPPAQTPSTYNPAPTSFEYIFDKVLSKSCNQPGCHDGSFEPDFRNMSSAYNSMVYAPIVNNPDPNTYTYRVKPGSSAQSVLKHRLTQIPGMTVGSTLTFGMGRMPWSDTNWKYVPQNATYIQNIIDWIDAGAKDVFGNPPVIGNKHPNTLGLQITQPNSSSAINRPKYINISKSNGPVDIWCYVVDDNAVPGNIQSAEIKFSTNRWDFSSAVTQTLTYVPNGNSWLDMPLDNTVQYNYKLSGFNLFSVLPDTGYIFIRTYIKDADHTVPGETPNNGSLYYGDYFIVKHTL